MSKGFPRWVANVFESSRVTSIDLELDLERSREVFQVSDAAVAYDEVDPGEEVTIYVDDLRQTAPRRPARHHPRRPGPDSDSRGREDRPGGRGCG
jgi:hypothetical protein